MDNKAKLLQRHELRIGAALQFCAVLANVNYDESLAANLLISGEAEFCAIRARILAVKAKKRHAAHLGRLSGYRRRSRERAAEGSFTGAQWLALCEAYDHRCAYCHQRRPLTKDHATPLARGGSNNIDNIRPACRSCNSKKGSK